MTDTPPRDLDVRISAAGQVGFVVWEAGAIVASLTSRAEVADWIEQRLGIVPGEREREDADRAAYSNVERMPNIAQPRTEKRRGRFF